MAFLKTTLSHKEERKAFQDLRKDDSHIVITADKGITLVIMDKGI